MKKSLSFLLLFVFGLTLVITAQEEKSSRFSLDLGADMASGYLWRGLMLDNGPVIQPWAQLSYGGLSLGAWASTDFTNSYQEIDLYLRYDYKNMSLVFLDLYSPGFAGMNQNFFDFKNSTTGHVAELSLSFNGSDKVPFYATAGVLLYGLAWDPKVNDSTKLNHSTYMEVGYLGSVNDIAYSLFAGFTPYESVFYVTNKFAFINVGATVEKDLNITDRFAIPASLTVAANPTSKQFFVVIKFSIN